MNTLEGNTLTSASFLCVLQMAVYLWCSRIDYFKEELSIKPDSDTRVCQHLEVSVFSNLSVVDLVKTFAEYITSSLAYNIPYYATQKENGEHWD